MTFSRFFRRLINYPALFSLTTLSGKTVSTTNTLLYALGLIMTTKFHWSLNYEAHTHTTISCLLFMFIFGTVCLSLHANSLIQRARFGKYSSNQSSGFCGWRSRFHFTFIIITLCSSRRHKIQLAAISHFSSCHRSALTSLSHIFHFTHSSAGSFSSLKKLFASFFVLRFPPWRSFFSHYTQDLCCR